MTQHKKLSEQEIDEIVIKQANNNAAWEKPVRVRRNQKTEIVIPTALAARAEFLARLHRQGSTQEWIQQIIQERVEIEEAAYTGAKREISSKG